MNLKQPMTNDPAGLEAAWDGKIPDNTPDKRVPLERNK